MNKGKVLKDADTEREESLDCGPTKKKRRMHHAIYHNFANSKLPQNLQKVVRDTVDEEMTAKEICDQNPNFCMVHRIHYKDITDEIINDYLYVKKEPLVITDTLNSIMKSDSKSKGGNKRNKDKDPLGLFSLSYLKECCSHLTLYPRDNFEIQDTEEEWTVPHYLDKHQTERTPSLLYGKDITCPDDWTKFLFDHSTLKERFVHKGKKDLMQDVPTYLKAITLMIYVGDNKTHTPIHRDVIGTLGHNIMVWSDGCDSKKEIKVDEKDATCKRDHSSPLTNEDTYSLWCIMSPKDIDLVREFWKQRGTDMDYDNCFLPLHYLKDATFKVSLVEQRLGDFVILPSNAPHQVVNRGGRSTKVAWNVITSESLQDSMDTLKINREYGKPQVYRIKTTAYHALKRRIHDVDATADEILNILKVMEKCIFDERIDVDDFDENEHVKILNEAEQNHTAVCDHCKCDIFNRYYHCDKDHASLTEEQAPAPRASMMGGIAPKAKNQSGYDLCLDCVAEGRSCNHVSNLKLCASVSLKVISKVVEDGRNKYIKLKENKNEAQNTLSSIKIQDQKSIATQAYLKISQNKNEQKCHHCDMMVAENDQVSCSDCSTSYCENCLHNNYKSNAVTLRQNIHWKCPKCSKVCNCRICLLERGVDQAHYAQEVNHLLQDGVIPFVERNVGPDLTIDQVGSVYDQVPKGFNRSELVHTGTKSKKKKLTIVGANKKIKIHHDAQDLNITRCQKCDFVLGDYIVWQNRKNKHYSCDLCFNNQHSKELELYQKESKLGELVNWIKYDKKCDKCLATIVGIRYAFPDDVDFCQSCYMSGCSDSVVSELDRKKMEMYVPCFEEAEISYF
ncbi:lysine-specific demethylase [Acrasis kona]|uniref:Lysine-specific demethylase n=1 Tax=Acrasis kona TaxID=1008807 RepID=A0AAW2ZQ52_9EUKA